jgi:hypothetical protein
MPVPSVETQNIASLHSNMHAPSVETQNIASLHSNIHAYGNYLLLGRIMKFQA